MWALALLFPRFSLQIQRFTEPDLLKSYKFASNYLCIYGYFYSVAHNCALIEIHCKECMSTANAHSTVKSIRPISHYYIIL